MTPWATSYALDMEGWSMDKPEGLEEYALTLDLKPEEVLALLDSALDEKTAEDLKG